MEPIDFTGHAALFDRRHNQEVNTGLRITLNIDTGRVFVGDGDDIEEVEFAERGARYSLGEVVSALRRHAYRCRPIRPVPKPRRPDCDVCDGTGIVVNPFSGERFHCPVCD